MSATATTPEYFVDRRGNVPVGSEPLFERRQFANSYDELSPEAASWRGPSTATRCSTADGSSRSKKCCP